MKSPTLSFTTNQIESQNVFDLLFKTNWTNDQNQKTLETHGPEKGAQNEIFYRM